VSLRRAEALARRVAPRDGLLPHVTGDDGRWELLSPLDAEDAALTGLPWTGGFVAGQLWLAGEHERAAVVTDLLRPRAAQPTTHDLGFLFWPSAALGLCATGDDCYRVLGLRAAGALAERALPNGVIQVIGALEDPQHRGRTIVDTWPNLLLLWWAERRGMTGAADAAAAHLEATLPALLRDDGSTFHAARLADDGAVLEQGTINGYAAGSTWARGQAWAMHGLASAHRATGGYRDEAERELRKLGRTTPRRARRSVAEGSGIEALSARELQVARLVSEGKSNPEIGAELFLSTKTVETHMRNIFRKLDAGSRVEVARIVERAETR